MIIHYLRIEKLINISYPLVHSEGKTAGENQKEKKEEEKKYTTEQEEEMHCAGQFTSMDLLKIHGKIYFRTTTTTTLATTVVVVTANNNKKIKKKNKKIKIKFIIWN